MEFMIENLEIRAAVESDADALALLVAQLGYPTESSAVKARLAEIFRIGDSVLVAAHEAEIVGLIVLHRTRFLHRPPDGRISTLVVLDSYRSRGIGANLVKAAERIFREWGCTRIEVTSGVERNFAHKFYIREGYIDRPKRFIKSMI